MIQELIDNNFLVIRNFINSEKAKELSDDFKKYCEENNLIGDSQVPNTPAKFNYIPFLELLCEKNKEISETIGEVVLPTYCYARVYKNQDVLDPHVDRDACEISLSIHLDGDKEWEIYVESPDKREVPINLKCGDAIVYLGCEALHWRNAFEGTFYSQVFLHYVRSRGEKSYAYFDVRKNKDNITLYENIKSTSKLQSFIQIYEDILPNDLCDLIIKHYQDDQDWENSVIGTGELDKKIRNCQILHISNENIINKNYQLRKKIDDQLFEVTSRIISDLQTKFNTISISRDTGYDLLKYETGGFYTQHTDSFTEQPREISLSFCINDDYDGGEFSFFNKELVYKLKKGSAITFPSNFLYPHQIMPVTRGTRYSIITWFI